MNREDYDRWASKYAETFGMSSDADVAMFDAWFEVFVLCKYTLAELNSARMAVARNPPTYRSNHLGEIHKAIRTARAAEARKRATGPVEGEVGTCTLCGGSGMVTVPHPEHALGGRWESGPFGYRATAAVVCHCGLGSLLLSNYDARPSEYRDRIKRPMRFEEYIRGCPGWKNLLDQRHKELTAVDRAADAAERADKAKGPLAGLVKKVVGGLKVFTGSEASA